ncbi:MxaD family protein [Amycolatopsis antarctica]|uniref:MxaD family protein n=1 Tax=Amycolatopsis antarctica TaxID=1854586 RepID=A0A263D7P4_9PSEU|nr:SRPBCC family protein [Amycolatopsis antarctica]OZM74453.1 MxaD family protein [Amycolatopsis antarctica]
MTHWYPLAESDDDFLRTAGLRFAHTIGIDAPPEVVWRVLAADDALTSWARGITGTHWTSPRPFGVGTTRTVTVGHGVAALRERFYRWDENERMTFTVDAANRAGLRRFAEDLVLTVHSGGTLLTWTFAVETASWSAPAAALLRPFAHRTTAAWARGVARRVSARSGGACR